MALLVPAGLEAAAAADVIHVPEAYLTGFLCIFWFFEEISSSSWWSCAASLARPPFGGCDDDDDDNNADSELWIAKSEFEFCCCCDLMLSTLLLEAAGSWASAHVLHGHEAITSSRKQSMVDCFWGMITECMLMSLEVWNGDVVTRIFRCKECFKRNGLIVVIWLFDGDYLLVEILQCNVRSFWWVNCIIVSNFHFWEYPI